MRFLPILIILAGIISCGKTKPSAPRVARNREPAPKVVPDVPVKSDDSPSTLDAPVAIQASLEQLGQQVRNAYYDRYQMSEAEALLQEMLKQNPNDSFANGCMAYVLTIGGRRWESAPHLLHLVRIGQCAQHHLEWLGLLNAIVDDKNELEKCRRAAPNDPLPLLGLARLALRDNQIADAEMLLRTAISQRPGLVEAHARLGHLLLDKPSVSRPQRAGETADAWDVWQQSLPANADQHPEIWAIRGLRASRDQDLRGAVRCFAEAIRRDPNHQLANYQLSQLFTALGKPELAKPFSIRAMQIVELAGVLHKLQDEASESTENMRQASVICYQLGRTWEAVGWCLVASKAAPTAVWPKVRINQLLPELKPDLPQTKPAADPSRHLVLADYPLPSWDHPTPRPTANAANLGVQFEDSASAVGIDFHYDNGHDPSRQGTRMFEVNGGGVAVIDYDLDGWPDLYWTQGGRWPPGEESPPAVDQLDRNRRGERFDSVTEPATLHEPRFGQGVTVGDYDSDGFPDLYVANIGSNRILRNQGDGTFADVTKQAGLSGRHWTASCLIADLNSDGLPDMYDVNYLQGDDIFERVCGEDGVIHVCVPRMFAAAPDQVWINLGDGRFQNQENPPDTTVHGMGLGIVAADFNGSGKLDLFVANDEMQNFYFRNDTKSGGDLKLFEQALLSGLAVDWQGRCQACMGVAVGDADGDGQLDLFITNFYQESNCFYRGHPGEMFADETQLAGLRAPGYSMLGFGTQFIDGDLNGRPDIVVANGNLDDRTDIGVPYFMPPQYFSNLGGGRFAELPRGTLGPFFQSFVRRICG